MELRTGDQVTLFLHFLNIRFDTRLQKKKTSLLGASGFVLKVCVWEVVVGGVCVNLM